MSRLQNKNFTAITGDATNLPLNSGSVDLIVTHPPYLGVDTSRYGGDPRNQINYGGRKRMMKLLTKTLKESYRVLKSHGSLVIAVNDTEEISERLVIAAVDKAGFKYLGRVYQNSYSYVEDWKNDERLVDNSVTVWHHFSKGSIYFNPFIVKRYNNPVWDLPFEDEDYVVDSINREIPNRFIQMFSKPGATVLDQFGGSGVVAVEACKLGRIGISLDISASQTKEAEARANRTFS